MLTRLHTWLLRLVRLTPPPSGWSSSILDPYGALPLMAASEEDARRRAADTVVTLDTRTDVEHGRQRETA